MSIEHIYKQTPTPSETPSLVREKLAKFEAYLNKLDEKSKEGYLMALQKCPGECSPAFKLVFLRCEVFDAERAVSRFVKYWDTRMEVFGEEKAFLSMTLEGAMKDDIEAIQMNYLQVATETDPDGRAILLFDFQKDTCASSSESLLKSVWYQVHCALKLESCQKRGIVVYTRSAQHLSDCRLSLHKQISLAGKGILPVRFAGMHMINPPTLIRVTLVSNSITCNIVEVFLIH